VAYSVGQRRQSNLIQPQSVLQASTETIFPAVGEVEGIGFEYL
jgi:hypothetical protein